MRIQVKDKSMQILTSPTNMLSKFTSSTLDLVTPMVLTFNEEVNIRRVLEKLTWASRVLVIDSFSTDSTLDILAEFPNVDIVQRKFDSFASQCNFGLRLVDSEWVLSLDADYVLTEKFIEEIESILKLPQYNAYEAEFRFCVFGKPLRRDNTTARKVLYKKNDAFYIDTGHQHRVQVGDEHGTFSNKINHDDRKSLSRWLSAQDRYLKIEAKKINHATYAECDLADKLRKTKILAPVVIFFYCLLVKGLFLNGWRGWYYTLQRTLVEILLAIRIIKAQKF